jgi:hypothetical protein
MSKEVPMTKLFGLIVTNSATWRDELDNNPILREYLRAGREAANTLVSIDNQMTAHISSKAVQIKNDPLGYWLAKELDRIIARKGPSVDSVNEFAVFDLAFRGYRWLLSTNNRIQDPTIQRFLKSLAQCMDDPVGSPSPESEVALYRCIGNFYREEVDRHDTTTSSVAQGAEIQKFCERVDIACAVEANVPDEPHDTRFTEIVKFAREKNPCGSAHRLFHVAKNIYRSVDRDLFGIQSYANVSKTIEKVQYARAKCEHRRRSKEKAGKGKEDLHKVTKSFGMKRVEKTVRFSASMMK